MKFWARKSQSKPNPACEFVEPKFTVYKTHCQTNYAESYSNLGPYGDPLPLHQDGVFHDSTSWKYGEEWFSFSNRYWNKYCDEDGLNGQAYGMYEPYLTYENFQPPDGGSSGGNWVGEYETYFVGGWGEDMFATGGYCSLDEESGPYGDAKVEGDLCWGGSYYSYNGGMEMEYPCYEDSFCWFGFWEDEGFNGLQENDNASLYGVRGLDEMRLCESIFGHWPCLEQGFA